MTNAAVTDLAGTEGHANGLEATWEFAEIDDNVAVSDFCSGAFGVGGETVRL